jgi:Secretion system C-terminal sorting domain
MKKLLLFASVIVGVASQAQTLTYLNHAPAWGNVPFQTAQCDSVSATPGASGAGVVWNFNPTNLNNTKNYITSGSMPSNPLYPNCNVAVTSSPNDAAYYFTDNATMKYYGGNMVLNGFQVSLIYNTPTTYANYPMSLSSNVNSTPNGTISLNSGALTGTFTGTGSSIASATGTLTLGSRTFTNVVRLTTTQNLNATLPLGAATLITTNYDFIAIGVSKAPIYSIQTSTLTSGAGTNTQTITVVLNNFAAVGVTETQNTITDLMVYPNPASDVINFSTKNVEASKVVIFDVTGKLVATQVLDNNSAPFNTSSLNNGLYIYTLVGSNNQALKSGKFTVSK